jgi:hypothetical protein
MTMRGVRTRLSTAAVATALLLLTFPTLASAHPGTGPELVQRSGRLVVLHADRSDGTTVERYALVNGARHIAVDAPAGIRITPGARVRLEGTLVGATLRLADSESAVTQTAADPTLAAADSTAAVPGVHTTALILVTFSTGGTWPPGSNPAQGAVISGDVNTYYQEQSYGQLGFSSRVFGPYALGSIGSCSRQQSLDWMTTAEEMAGTTGTYQHVILAFPQNSGCPWTGQATIGGSEVWDNGAPSLRVLAHELGHNLGIGHAGGLDCGSATISGSCSPPAIYGDPFDPMGYGPVVRQMSMEHKLALGLLPPSAVKVIGSDGAYHLAPMETLSGTAELLRIPKSGGGNYYVEYRAPIGTFDGQAPALQGVFVRTEGSGPGEGNGPDTLLIDMHPATSGDWSDAAMDVGQTFSDPIAGVTITNLVQDAGGAELAISAPKDVVPPSAPSGLTAIANGTSAVLHWTAATDDYQVDGYVVTRDGENVATTATTDFVDSDRVPGRPVAYSVSAIDAGRNVGPPASVSVVMPDTSAPAAPAKVTARLTREGKVHLAWAAAVDNGQIAYYRVLRNGSAIATASALAYVDSAARAGAGRHVTYAVMAVDLAGNAGPAGRAPPLRSALLRRLAASALRVTHVRARRATLRVRGKLSDASARCRLRVGTGAWHRCKAKADGVFSVTLRARGAASVTLSLRDSLGRVTTESLRVR